MLLSPLSASGQTIERPLLVEMNFSPVLIALVGESIADETVDRLTVESWMPGLTLGYRVAERLTVGYSWHPGFDLVLGEAWGFAGVSDLDIDLPHQTGDVHALDARVLPFGGGFQITASYIYVAATDFQMDGTRLGATMALGVGDYPTDVVSTWSQAASHRAALGLGYSWTASSGLSLSLGLGVPIPFGDGDVEDSAIVPSDAGVTFAPPDVASGVAALDAETFFAPVLLRIGVGWAFGIR